MACQRKYKYFMRWMTIMSLSLLSTCNERKNKEPQESRAEANPTWIAISQKEYEAVVLIERDEMGELFIKLSSGRKNTIDLIGNNSLLTLKEFSKLETNLQGFMVLASAEYGANGVDFDKAVKYFPIRSGEVEFEILNGSVTSSVGLDEVESWISRMK